MAIKLEKQMGLIVLVLSILAPGWSSILAGFLAKGDNLKPGVIVGVLQMLTCFLLVGWIWSIWVGYTIYKNSQ